LTYGFRSNTRVVPLCSNCAATWCHCSVQFLAVCTQERIHYPRAHIIDCHRLVVRPHNVARVWPT